MPVLDEVRVLTPPAVVEEVSQVDSAPAFPIPTETNDIVDDLAVGSRLYFSADFTQAWQTSLQAIGFSNSEDNKLVDTEGPGVASISMESAFTMIDDSVRDAQERIDEGRYEKIHHLVNLINQSIASRLRGGLTETQAAYQHAGLERTNIEEKRIHAHAHLSLNIIGAKLVSSGIIPEHLYKDSSAVRDDHPIKQIIEKTRNLATKPALLGVVKDSFTYVDTMAA